MCPCASFGLLRVLNFVLFEREPNLPHKRAETQTDTTSVGESTQFLFFSKICVQMNVMMAAEVLAVYPLRLCVCVCVCVCVCEWVGVCVSVAAAAFFFLMAS